MGNINFFSWIREGVKQSVLLGVSDAIETLGTPADGDDLHPRLMEFLKDDPKRPVANEGGKRKRLGRSLKEIEAESENAA